MLSLFRKRMKGEKGFTLIELLVVIIIIAILAAIAIPTFFGQREKAQDTAAYTLVRNGLTVMQTAFVETGDYSSITAAMLNGVDVAMTWTEAGSDLVSTSPPAIDGSVVADATANEILFYPQSRTIVDIASRSESGNWFGIQVDTMDLSETGYVKVRVVDGSADVGW